MKTNLLIRYTQKKYLFCYMLAAMILFLLCEPQTAADSARFGLLLWANRLLPSLLPFLILCQLLLHSGCLDALSKRLRLPLSYFVLFAGTLFGFPMGAKLTADLYAKRLLSDREAALLFVISNQMSPAFVGGYILSETLKRPRLIPLTYLLLYAPALTFGTAALYVIHRKHHTPPVSAAKKPPSGLQLNITILDAGIMNSFETMLKLAGYVMLFAVLSGMCQVLLSGVPAVHSLIAALLEITGAVSSIDAAIADERLKYAALLAATAFGGCSGIAQTASLARLGELPKPLSIRRYLCGRILLAACSALSALLFYPA